MARHLHWQYATSRYITNVHDGYRLRVWIDEAVGVTTKVFAYQLLPFNPVTGTRVGAFDHVCSPPDLEEYPEDEPRVNARPEWFRLDYVDVQLRSEHEVTAYLTDILSDLAGLQATLEIMDTLTTQGSGWIGGAPVGSSSSSSQSSSLSSSHSSSLSA